MIQSFNNNDNTAPVVDYAFDILSAVSQGDFTKWTIVYDISNKTIRFRTQRFQQIKVISFSGFDFNCTSPSKVWDMNQAVSGNIDRLFENFTASINKRIIETAAKESVTQVPISKESQEALWKYTDGIKCR